MDDFRESITTVRCGNAAGNSGPLFVLAKGKKMNCASVANQIKEQAPPESKALMTPNSFMTDETWLELSHSLGKGIRSVPVVKDHPDWWFLLCMDGYGSHLQPEALEILETYKIFVVKEEADSLHINQASDQFVAKADKRIIRRMIDHVRSRSKGFIFNLWTLSQSSSSLSVKLKRKHGWTRSSE